MGLVLTLKVNEGVMVGDTMIKFHSFDGAKQIKLHFDGPKDVKIGRIGIVPDHAGIKKVQRSRRDERKEHVEIFKKNVSVK